MSSQPSLGEFDIIDKYFQKSAPRQDVILGVGDDAAVVALPDNSHIAISTDTLVEGVHFFADIPPRALGHKALAVNLSDMAAMGAEPRWVTLAITLPEINEAWLAQFSKGFYDLAEYFNVSLIGGDTTKGPLSITVTVHGVVPHGKALRRDGAKPGDWIYVTGNLGDSGLALAHLQNQLSLSPQQLELSLKQHYFPQPRVLAGYGLRDIASATIDISDGLYNDLGHILRKSSCSATLKLEQLPLSETMNEAVSIDQSIAFALNGGEDYELCFTVPESNKGSVDTSLSFSGIQYTCIGQLAPGKGEIKLQYKDKPYQLDQAGWDHFV
ncbi:thiamine-phosphate kinase [Agarivorans sp. Toyoura001]|uniref:thiamine-phosphate kinase n=1 Tax=unclassified Agarivorans TaxID=2636026 RepID=UPI0010E27C6B|nr:thiamine-phosphate kinase [Agarivorans sp. Toyoura001]GDY24544.1 thiamine-monophosphate kinase [Agarivorans sp. Toyoura001]